MPVATAATRRVAAGLVCLWLILLVGSLAGGGTRAAGESCCRSSQTCCCRSAGAGRPAVQTASVGGKCPRTCTGVSLHGCQRLAVLTGLASWEVPAGVFSLLGSPASGARPAPAGTRRGRAPPLG